MCGFAGFFQPEAPLGVASARARAALMVAPIAHRGPDDQATFDDADGSFAVGFRRLSIIDLSPTGRQPMVSASGRFVIAFNGEIYNADELRATLIERGFRFRGRSDTEAMLESFDTFGIDATLGRLIGMFAISLWDRKLRRLILARDRLGIKPLYWYRRGKHFLFASQPKSFFAHDGFAPEIDRDALQSYLRFGYVPAPFSIFEHCSKLEPGTWLEIDARMQPRIERYWNLCEIAAQGMAEPLEISEQDAQAWFNDLLEDAVARRMTADVPLGALLSGGIDSSAVAALMQKQSSRSVKTFSIGFAEAGFDEAPHARAVAAHLGTDHQELYVDAHDVRAIVPDLANWYDEPFADNSAAPTLLLSQLTRQHVTVALSGDGGDELFAGYNRYWQTADLFERRDGVPHLARKAATALLALAGPVCHAAERSIPSLEAALRPAYRADKLRDLLSGEPAWMMRHICGHWQQPGVLALGGRESIDPIWLSRSNGRGPQLVERLQLVDMLTYLPEDILAKLDRASMAAGLEARVPLLDHRIVELAWRLPAKLRSRRAPVKHLLRSVLARHLPAPLIDRPKQGFSMPTHLWLRSELKTWAADLLDPSSLRRSGLVEPGIVQRCWQQHQAAQADWRFPLWNILMLESWHRHWCRDGLDLARSGEACRLSTNHPTVAA